MTMRRGRRCRSLAVAVAVGLALPAGAPGAAQSVSAAPNHVDKVMSSVSADSATDAWAVGDVHGRPSGWHWDGASWVETPISASPRVGVVDVLSLAPHNAFGVGSWLDRDGLHHALITHWNGEAWARMSRPHIGSGCDFTSWLSAVGGTSGRDVWAVGHSGDCNSKSLILHWNGTRWRHLTSPYGHYCIYGACTLRAVSADRVDDAWAVGGALVAHWNGRSWQRAPLPEPRRDTNLFFLTGVTALSPRNVWAVGRVYVQRRPNVLHDLILHWNGTQWSRVHSPEPGPMWNELADVDAVSARDVWAVGTYHDATKTPKHRSLIIHWNGTAWSRVASPQPGRASDVISVSALSGSNAWVVGSYVADETTGLLRCLVLHWNGQRWTRMPSP
ncbi:MAG TPA: hypothetical protein VE441_05940 [Mycobacterium sp.]|jgi:hypothetical protein|nr:hypothetical protein [Mycobacterium sp.]